MAGFQFMHVESYGRSAGKGKSGGHSVSTIVGEARRDPEHSTHVESPLPPQYLQGASLDALEATCEAYAATITDSKGRKMRKDGLCLLAGVVSAPEGFSDAQWSKLSADTVSWLQGRFEERLRTTIAHADESHDHLHFYVVPRDGERFDDVHPGKAAARLAKEQGLPKGEQNKAYIAAMRAFQDEFFEQVGAKNGLSRLGPGRRRLTREEWKQEQSAVELLAQQFDKADALVADAGHALEGVRTDVERIRSDALAEIRQMQEKATRAADRAISEGRKQGIEQGQTEALEQFGKSSLWAKLTGLLTRKDDEIRSLKTEVKTLRKERDKAVKQAEKSTGIIATVKAAGKRVAERFLGLEQERDSALTRAEKAERQRDHFREEVKVLRERDGDHAELVADRDFQQARADAAERKLARLETPGLERGKSRNIAKNGDDLTIN